MKSKAVLEFNYTEDEDKLSCALRGEDYRNALVDILNILDAPFSNTVMMEEIRTLMKKFREELTKC